jgi:syntaxin 5
MAAARVPTGTYSYSAHQLSQFQSASARASEMQQVEGTIIELGHMFTRMAQLVSEQGEVADRIDADMDLVTDNVTAGALELQKFLAATRKHRAFIVKMLLLLALVILLFAAFNR